MKLALIKFRPNQDEFSPVVTCVCIEEEIWRYSKDLDFAVLLRFETDILSLSVDVEEYLETK